jgi:hypothetical protein
MIELWQEYIEGHSHLSHDTVFNRWDPVIEPFNFSPMVEYKIDPCDIKCSGGQFCISAAGNVYKSTKSSSREATECRDAGIEYTTKEDATTAAEGRKTLEIINNILRQENAKTSDVTNDKVYIIKNDRGVFTWAAWCGIAPLNQVSCSVEVAERVTNWLNTGRVEGIKASGEIKE